MTIREFQICCSPISDQYVLKFIIINRLISPIGHKMAPQFNEYVRLLQQKIVLKYWSQLQKTAAAVSVSFDDFSAVLKLQNFILESGFNAVEVAEAFSEVLAGSENVVKMLAKQMLAALDHPRLRESDLLAGTLIAKAFDFVAVS